MSALGERVLFQHLTDPDSLRVLALEGLDEILIPDVELRPIYRFSLDYYYASGRALAPTKAVYASTELGAGRNMALLLEDREISLDEEPEESVEWAIEDLKSSFVHKTGSTFVKSFATAMAEADSMSRVDVMSNFATDLVTTTMALQGSRVRVDVRHSMEERILSYESRRDDRQRSYGMTFGLPIVDNHTFGIHEGELAIWAAFAKLGKSWWSAMTVLHEFRVGRCPVLFTLENSIPMTEDRIACLAQQVDYTMWERGLCAPDDLESVREWQSEYLHKSDVPFWVIKPEPGHRMVEQMVREAQILGAQSLIIDQLSFIEHPDPRGKPYNIQVMDILHSLKNLISTGRDVMPCLVLAQINREGKKAADKVGYHEMWHLAETSAGERVADWVFSGYQSRDFQVVGRALLQTLASRRTAMKNWELEWQPHLGRISVLREVDRLDA